MSVCNICPRKCNIDREDGKRGFCNSPASLSVAKIMLHKWEEPCICYGAGSGTVFFSGCNLGCIYCQNRRISRGGCGDQISEYELEKEILSLVERGASCIEFVTPTHFAEKLVGLLSRIKNDLPVPTVYNSGGYESVETLKCLEGLIDIYMPDLKYFSPELSEKYSHAADYPRVALAALAEMLRQTGAPEFFADSPERLKSGIILRHLILPSHRADSIKVLEAVSENIGAKNVILSLMGQYTPDFYIEYEKEHGEREDCKSLRRRLTSFEYKSVLQAAERLGFAGYMQDISSASTRFTPEF